MKTTRGKSSASIKKSSGKRSKIYRAGWLKLTLRILKIVVILFVASSVFFVLLFRFVNPPVTWLMIQRGFERKAAGKEWKIDKKWKDFDSISTSMKRAAVAAEDQTFLENLGVDVHYISIALK